MKTRIMTLVLFTAASLPQLCAQDITIHISGPGATAKYIKEGDTQQLPVEVHVGQTVRFTNRTGTTTTHTASSVLKDSSGARIFETQNIPVGGMADVVFDMAKYTNAGGAPGGQVELDYICTRHPTTMKSKIIFKDTVRVMAALRVRKDVMTLTQAEVDALRKGVEVMRGRPATDRKSWSYWASIHGQTTPSSDPLHNQCTHGTIDFLVWHRAYLYYFEQILREASGDPNLTLPYWNWTTHRKLPPIYRDPVGVAANPLFDPLRALNNPAFSLPSSVVTTDLNNAMAKIGYFPGFCQDFDMNTHGDVHTNTGGLGGTMSRISTSANDPVFYSHHANVDRIWNVWLAMGRGRKNPTDPAFLNKQYTFVDTSGVDVTITAARAISSVALGYRYDHEPEMEAIPLRIIASSRPVNQEFDVAETAIPLRLDAVRVPLRPTGDAESITAAITAASESKTKVAVRVKGISYLKMPGFVYGVYLQLPAGQMNPKMLDRHRIGTISFFSQEGHPVGKHEASELTTYSQVFDASKAIARLRAAEVNLVADLEITLLPITLEADPGHEDELRQLNVAAVEAAQLTFTEIELLTE